MKNICILLLTFLAISCCHNKEGETISPEDTGFYIISKLNNQDWKGDVVMRKSTLHQDTLVIGGSEKVKGSGLVMRIKFNGIGSYSMIGGQFSYWTMLGDDIILSIYELGNGESAKMEITHYDSTSKIVEGQFEGILRKRNGDVDLPDSLNFVSGKFRGKIDV